MRYNEKVDMFMGMCQLLNADIDTVTKNIQARGVDNFREQLKTTIKGDYDCNIGNMRKLVKKYMS